MRLEDKKNWRSHSNLFFSSKLRHGTVVLAEAESALATCNKILGTKRTLFTQLDNKLYEVREAKVNPTKMNVNLTLLNIELQQSKMQIFAGKLSLQ